jgi:putative ubiquitin-RnfH superfamily antitoxin RatB of RatAB toxin-antitoxin module
MAPAELAITLVRSPEAERIERMSLRLAAPATVGDALRHAGWGVAEGEMLGLWGRKVGLDEPLQDGDRVEVYRPLTVDPMQARHRRHALQGGRRIVSRHRPG